MAVFIFSIGRNIDLVNSSLYLVEIRIIAKDIFKQITIIKVKLTGY